MAIGDSLKNIIMPDSDTTTPSSNLQSVINPSTTTTQSTPYKSVNIGGNSFTTDYMNDPNNVSTLQKLVASNQNNMSYTGNDGKNYDLMTGKEIPTSTSAPMTYTPTNTVTNNSGQITDMYGQQLAAAQAALKASIQQSMGQYQDTIKNAPGQYQPLRDQASYAGATNLQNNNEMLANDGQQGGVNRTENTAINSSTENNINTLNAQQQQVIDTANKAINDLQAQGDIKGAELVAQNASDKIKALIDESNRVDSTTYSRGQDAFNNGINIAGLTGTYNGNQTIQGKASDANIAASNASTAGQLIQNQYAPQIAQGQIDANKATTAYQTMLNNSYPQEEALKIAGIIAQNQSLVLDNNAKAIANKYQPQILQGQIDGTKLANTYQALVNNGYKAAQAADIAVKYATIRQGDTQNAIAQYNANTSRMSEQKSGSSGGGGGSSNSSSNSNSNNVSASAWDTMSNIYQKYGYSTMISWLSQNKSSITSSVGKDEYQKMVDAASKLQQNIRNNTNYNDKSKAW